MPQPSTSDILRGVTPPEGTPLEALLRVLARRAQPGAEGYPGGSPPEGRELSSRRLAGAADLTASIFGHPTPEATAMGASPSLKLGGTLRASSSKARPLINRFLEELVPSARSRLTSPQARSGRTAIPWMGKEGVYDVDVVPQEVVNDISAWIFSRGNRPTGFMHGRFSPEQYKHLVERGPRPLLTRMDLPKAGVPPSAVVAEEASAVTGPHEFAHVLFAQLRPSTAKRFMESLRGEEGSRIFSQVQAEWDRTKNWRADDAMTHLIDFRSSVDSKERLRLANEIFARMFDGAIPPTRMAQKLMTPLGMQRAAERSEMVL